jgi:hypothetical protein
MWKVCSTWMANQSGSRSWTGRSPGSSTWHRVPGYPMPTWLPGSLISKSTDTTGWIFPIRILRPTKCIKPTYALWKEGVTSYLPTVITRDQERLAKSFALLAQSRKDEILSLSIPGFHLEGPYISPVKGYRGAHPAEHIRLPDWEEFTELQENAEQGIKLVAVAPEMEGAIPFTAKCSESGLVVTLAHHNGSPGGH